MITNIYVYTVTAEYNENAYFENSYATLERAIDAAYRNYDHTFYNDDAFYGREFLTRKEFGEKIQKRMDYSEAGYCWYIQRVKMEVDIPKVENPTTVGDIVCGGFDVSPEYVVYRGVHDDGDVLWDSSVNGKLTTDDIVSQYVVTYMTIDYEMRRLIIETL